MRSRQTDIAEKEKDRNPKTTWQHTVRTSALQTPGM
jgi:hypothetical protein